MNYSDYNIGEHTHRYACWCAARAASKSRFSNIEIGEFIEDVGLRNKVVELKKLGEISYQDYKEWFIIQANSLLNRMALYKPKKEEHNTRNIAFGIAAKIISVYIKTVEIIPSGGKSLISQVAIPPIDRYLLKAVKKRLQIVDTAWSKMNKSNYMEVVEKLKTLTVDMPFWSIEYYWNLNEMEGAE